jgi:hypothetical protein
MTPEERQDKLEGDLAQMREDHDISIRGLRRFALQYFKANQADHKALMAQQQAFMAAIRAERETRKAEHLARMAEIQADRERQKKAEGRVDGVEEMTKLLRELLEANLRRPEPPPEATT